ncbi:MAG TPA: hypothetical protein VIJ25_19930, partial [Methylococcales bacterium]
PKSSASDACSPHAQHLFSRIIIAFPVRKFTTYQKHRVYGIWRGRVKRFFAYSNANNCKTKDLQQAKKLLLLFSQHIREQHNCCAQIHIYATSNSLPQKLPFAEFPYQHYPYRHRRFANVAIKFLFFYFSFEKKIVIVNTLTKFMA